MFARQEFIKHQGCKNEWLCALLLYVILVSLFPIAFGGWSQSNLWIVPAIMWISALLVSVVNQENLLCSDFKLGVFDIIVQSEYSLSTILFLKIIMHWMFYALPHVLLAPILCGSFGLSGPSAAIITCSLLMGTLFLSFMAAIGAALTVTLARGGVFLALIMLPLYIPVLCLGTNLGVSTIEGFEVRGQLALLCALVIMAMLFVPITVAAAIKVNME